MARVVCFRPTLFKKQASVSTTENYMSEIRICFWAEGLWLGFHEGALKRCVFTHQCSNVLFELTVFNRIGQEWTFSLVVDCGFTSGHRICQPDAILQPAETLDGLGFTLSNWNNASHMIRTQDGVMCSAEG